MGGTQPDGSLPTEDLLQILYWMKLTRALDERIFMLYKQGRFPGTSFSQRGHEAISVGSSYALETDDVIAPMHRDLGAYLVRGISPGRVIAQHMGRVGAPSRGRDVNTHGIGDLSLNIIGYVSHLPQSMPVALGAAFSFQYRGADRVALTYTGDGASSEGGFHETLNFAAVLRAPLIVIIENNQYAFQTPLKYQFVIENLADRAAGYGIPGVAVDGNDVLSVHEATKEAIGRARRGEGPTLIECKTMRMRGHAFHDPASYVPQELIDEWAERDPLDLYTDRLRKQQILGDAEEQELESRIRREIDEAVEWAEASPWPDPGSLIGGVYADA